MKSKKAFPYGSLVIGVLIAMIGIACVVLYILEAIIARIGEPDQSLLFWYSPILFIGFIGIITGMGIGIWGAMRLRKIREEEATREN